MTISGGDIANIIAPLNGFDEQLLLLSFIFELIIEIIPFRGDTDHPFDLPYLNNLIYMVM